MKILEEKYFFWLWGENNIRSDHPNYLINLEIGVSIRFDYSQGFFSSYEEFYNSIADVQFIYGTRPDDPVELERILTDAWNYMAIEERLLEGELDELTDDEIEDIL